MSIDSPTATGFVVTLKRHPAGQIIVDNVLDNSTTSQNFGYETSYAGAITVQGDGLNRSNALAPGIHEVEPTTQPAGWDLVSSVCDDGSDPATIDLADGEKVTCTFTYHRQPSDIIIRKETVPDGYSQSFSFSSTQFGNFSLSDGQSLTRTFQPPGTYDVSETVPAGWQLTSATCDDGSSPSAIDLDQNEVVTCTFTNTALPGAFNVGGVSGNDKDVLKLTPAGGGGYTVSLYWRGGNHGFNLKIGGVELP